MAPATDPVTPDDVASTIFQQLGVNPHQELQTPTGRPVQLFRERAPLDRCALIIAANFDIVSSHAVSSRS